MRKKNAFMCDEGKKAAANCKCSVRFYFWYEKKYFLCFNKSICYS